MSGPALEVREPSARYFGQDEPALIRGFWLTVTAAGGIATLRATILSLALQGKLVEQRADDESAATLLTAITAEKTRLALSGLVKPGRSGGGTLSAPVELPHGWLMATLADLCVVVTDGDHLPPPKASRGVPFLVIGDVRAGRIDLSKAERFVPAGYFESLDWIRRPKAGDVLYTTVGSFGISISVLRDEEFCFQRHIALLRPGVLPLQPYLHLALKSPMVFAQAEHGATGIAQKTVSLAVLRSMYVPLPPLVEQHRIVARVEELMKLCDALEQCGRLADEQHARLTSTLFDALAASESAHSLAENWQRIAEHFDLLLDRSEAIDALEQTILQLAVRGLLVPQDEGVCRTRGVDVTASEAAPGCLVSLPAGWERVGFLDVCSVSGGSTPSKARADFWDGQVPWVSPKDMKRDVIGDAIDHVSEQALTQTSLSLVPTGSVLIVVRGMILAHSFPVAITSAPVTINQDMKAFSPRAAELAPYLALVCKGFKREILSMVERSTHGTCKLESTKLFGWRFGLPPLAEQRRIVARVEELRRLCTQLRTRLTAAQRTQSQLADALVAQAVA